MSGLPSHIVDALEALKEKEIEISSSNALQVRAWLYLLRFLSSFNYFYNKKNPYSSIELSTQQASLFAFGIDEHNPENFLFFCQEADFWWLNEIQIEYVAFIEKYLIIKFPPLDYENHNIQNDSKISIRSLTISIPLSDMYLEYLNSQKDQFKTMFLGQIKKSAHGFNKLEIEHFSEHKIPVIHPHTAITKQHFKANSTRFL
ncbi:hypothetical protein [Acinetobacter gyllenbergii]|uniref:hypothetical protein n=1 Tax=Acinetobacter gyllenbergii TaxID=134534 RepID=UPI003F568955